MYQHVAVALFAAVAVSGGHGTHAASPDAFAFVFTSAVQVPATGFDDCGELVEGVECVLFQSDNFGLYLLDDNGPFGVGDRVRVTGILDPGCFTICLEGDGCILENTIASCCPADLDDSGAVDFGDILAVLSAWGPCEGDCPEDLDYSGDVGFSDLLIVLGSWGPCE